MNVPEKLFSAYGWKEICVYMFVKRHLADGALGVSYQRVADEFGMTKGKVRHLLDRMISEGLLPTGIRSSAAPVAACHNGPSAGNTHTTPITAERKKIFYNSLVPYVQKYGREMVREFYDYWSEANPSGKKMRFEMQKTWDLNLRLARWSNNSQPAKAHGLHSDGTILHAGQMDYEKDGW